MENITNLFLGLHGLTTQLTSIRTGCALVVLLSPLKIISIKELMRFIMTLWVRLRLLNGIGVTCAQTTLLTALEHGRVLFLLPKMSTRILRPGFILTQMSSRSQNPLLEVVQERANLGALLLLLTKLALQNRV